MYIIAVIWFIMVLVSLGFGFGTCTGSNLKVIINHFKGFNYTFGLVYRQYRGTNEETGQVVFMDTFTLGLLFVDFELNFFRFTQLDTQ